MSAIDTALSAQYSLFRPFCISAAISAGVAKSAFASIDRRLEDIPLLCLP